MRKQLIMLLVAVTMCGAAALAQSRSALRINEVMVDNTESITDEYGNRSAWIELFNANFSPIEISAVYLTNDSTQPKKYPVPLGDVNTRIAKRQHVVFFADGQPNKGTFHTNFVLTPGQDNWVYVYDANGTTLIDKVFVPATVGTNQTWARTADGEGEWALRTGGETDYITPSSANVIRDTNSKIEDFAQRDANGFGMTVMAMCIVFSALLMLCLSFYAVGKIGAWVSRRNKARTVGSTDGEVAKASSVSHDSGEEIAAIVMALHEHMDTHDRENTILTINKVKRAYSPWSSKIYSLREVPATPTHKSR